MGTFVHCWWECKMVQPLWKTVRWFLKKLKIELSYNPAILLLGIYPKELNKGMWTDICTSMFIAVHSQKPKGESNRWIINRWTDKQDVVYTHNGILFSLKKERNSDTCYNMGEPWRHYKWHKRVTKGQILYDSTPMMDLE